MEVTAGETTEPATAEPSGSLVARPHRFPDPAVVDGSPVPHRLSLGLEDKSSLEKLVAMLDSYLNTEPYILRNPAPRVALVEGELHLQFYALPNLSKAEHALLDATVKRLRPHPTEGPSPDSGPKAPRLAVEDSEGAPAA